MHARKLALAMMMFGSTATHAQFGMTPMMNPLALANPLAVLGLGGMVNPMGMGMMAPIGSSMMSAQMYNPQAMMNPYLNPMAANNPYLNPMAGMGNPFLPQQPRQASPSFFPMMPGAPAPAYGGYGTPAPAYGGYSGYGYGYPAAPAQATPMSFPFFPTPAQPAPAPAQAVPFNFFPMPAQPAPVPTPAPAQAAPMLFPFFPMPAQPAPAPTPAPVAPSTGPQSTAPVGTPFDPMMFFQMMGGGMPAAPSPAAPR